jgi:hypothetical protein
MNWEKAEIECGSAPKLTADIQLRLQDPLTVLEEARHVARAAFPKGTLCLSIAAALGPVCQDR